jgi:hypothetical protein
MVTVGAEELSGQRDCRPLVLLDSDVSTWTLQQQTSRAAASGLDQGCPVWNISWIYELHNFLSAGATKFMFKRLLGFAKSHDSSTAAHYQGTLNVKLSVRLEAAEYGVWPPGLTVRGVCGIRIEQQRNEIRPQHPPGSGYWKEKVDWMHRTAVATKAVKLKDKVEREVWRPREIRVGEAQNDWREVKVQRRGEREGAGAE